MTETPIEPKSVIRAHARAVHQTLSHYRRGLAVLIYAAVAVAAYGLAILLRFEFAVPEPYLAVWTATLPLLVLCRLGAIWTFRLTMGRWRFVGTDDVVRLLAATSLGSVAFALVTGLLPLAPAIPRSVILIEWTLTVLATSGIWIGYRSAYEFLKRKDASVGSGGERRVLIVGAGEGGNLLAREIIRFPTGYKLVGFVDDDPLKRGTTMHGIAVIGGTDALGSLAESHAADEIIVAIPSASPGQLRELVRRCERLPIPFKVLPGISEVLEGRVSLKQLRPLQIEDLLGREPVTLALPELERDLAGRTVLVTGAAGSIGSELSRQIAVQGPGRLVLFDQAESDMYFVGLELADRHPSLDVACVVGDIMDDEHLRSVFARHRPERVYHAAAYKHVPLMELNARTAVRNNVLGTWRVARTAAEHGAGKLVLISTDKAVDPISVMGATKRAAELVVMAAQSRFPDTAFTAVRFGNVLGSNGSVIPLFQRQIREGKAVTVTHPEVTRYFMTIREAVQLVLQASSLREARGRIAMLDMGDPVRIQELAENVIRLAGLRVGHDVEIRFTGLRPGEKLHEKLAAQDEETLATPIEKVRLIQRDEPRERLAWVLDQLVALEGAEVDFDFRGFLGECIARPLPGDVELPRPEAEPPRSGWTDSRAAASGGAPA